MPDMPNVDWSGVIGAGVTSMGLGAYAINLMNQRLADKDKQIEEMRKAHELQLQIINASKEEYILSMQRELNDEKQQRIEQLAAHVEVQRDDKKILLDGIKALSAIAGDKKWESGAGQP